MLNKIIDFSIRNKLIVGLFTLGLIIYGIISLMKLPIDAVPDITNNQVMVITVSPGLGAPDVERFITVPVEQVTRNVPGIKEQRSFSRFGLSIVTVVFDDATDVYWARQQISERLITVQSLIPAGMGTPEMGPVTTGLGEIFQYVVKTKPGYEGKYSLMELRSIQDWVVRRQLLGTQGVADVSSFGGSLKQYEVAVKTDQLKSFGLTISDVFKALQENNQNAGGAYIEKGPNVLFIRTEGLVKNLEDMGNIVVKRVNGAIPVLIRDIAVVQYGQAIRYGATVYGAEGEVPGAVVMMLKGGNSNEVIHNIKEKIKIIETSLPEGVIIEPFLDRTKMVDNAIGTVKTNLIEGALIVVFVLVIFLGNLRAGFIVASVIPLSLLFAMIMMNLAGTSGNLMSLGALDFGLLVDGGVIIVEAVLHKLHFGIRHRGTGTALLSQHEMDEEVAGSSKKMMNAAAFGQIIILVVYLPVLTLEGIEGKMFRPMAETVSFAILGAFLLSLTYIPMMSSLFLSKKLGVKPNWSDRMMTKITNWYTPLLHRLLNFPKTIVGVSVALFAVAFYIMTTLGGEFIPKLEEGDFAVETRLLTGSSLSNTVDAVQKTAKVLLDSFPEVKKVVTKIGSGEIPTDPMPLEAADMMVILKDKKEWTSAKTFDQLAERMSNALQQVPGVTTGFQFPVQMRFNELMTGARQDVVCKIFGDDLDSLAATAERMGLLINQVEGAKDLYVETVTGVPQMVITYKRDAIARYGASVSEINRIVQAAYAGSKAGEVFEGDKRYDLVVRLNNDQKADIANLNNLMVGVADGLQVPLYELATIEMKEGPYQIQREEARRRIMVGFNVRGRDVQSIVEELQQKVKTHIKLPTGYSITYGGQYENLQNATNRLSIALPVALLLIFILLYFAFNKIKYGLLIFSAIPLSATGGVFSLWLRDMPFSISAGVGFIALFGVAVLNGIVLITEIVRLRTTDESPVKDIVVKATEARLRPILMTASVASLGFLPMALSNGAGAEVQRPLATVVIGGLLTATILTLVVLPCLYMLFDRRSQKSKHHMKALSTIGLMILCGGLSAQMQASPTVPVQKMHLEEVLQLAAEKAPGLQVSRLQEKYYGILPSTARDIPKTQFGSEFGNYNTGAGFDAKISIVQPFSSGMLYQKQKNLFETFLATAKVNTAVQVMDVKRLARQLYVQLQYFQSNHILLNKIDSIFASYQRIATLRLEKGETNLLEKTSIDNMVMQNKLLISMQDADFHAVQLQLGLLLQADARIVALDPLNATVKLFDSAQWRSNPYIVLYQKQQAQAVAETELAKARMKPDWQIGYNNQSLNGWQMLNDRTEKQYKIGDRFSSVTLGLSVPVFARAQKQKVNAAKANEAVAAAATQVTVMQLQSRLNKAWQEYEKYSKAVLYYEKTALKQAEVIIQTANLNYKNGQINYIEWGMLLNQAIGIKSQYIEALRQLNIAESELNYLFNN
ncbi:MAG TPA: CusA/CzcA family heavy metal efflux RND transporter [Sediminibacterium sp.]|nr:CusA/CzcA family heavy metal efflux RND transporter [Sediminibacterium sp.]